MSGIIKFQGEKIMKKFTAILLSAIIVCAMAVTVSAALPNLKGITKDGYTAYPLYDDAGIYTKGVTLYHHNGDKITQEELNGKIGKDWDQNVFKNAEGQSELIIWTRGGIRFCNPAHGICEIVFTGTGIRLGTGYRNGDPNTTFANNKAKITIDGKEVETNPDLLKTENKGDDGTPTIYFEIEGLENKTHKLVVTSANNEHELTWFEINGTLGEKVPSPATSDAASIAVVAAVAALAGAAVVIKKRH